MPTLKHPSVLCLLFFLVFLPTVLSKVMIRKPFPHVEIHEREVQRFKLEEYFYGNSLSFFIPPEHESPHLYFDFMKTTCSGYLKSSAIQAVKYVHPSRSEIPFLFTLNKEFNLTQYTVIKSCPTDGSTISLRAMARDMLYDLLFVDSFIVGAPKQRILCYVKTIMRQINCPTCKEEDIIISFEWGFTTSPEQITLSAAGSLKNATLQFHQDMLIAYYKCKDRLTCAENSKGKNAIYVYQISGQKLDELAPYLVARLDAEFFRKPSIKIGEVQAMASGLVVCDLENNVVFLVDLSATNRLPVIVQNYTFMTRVDSVAARFFGSGYVTYVSSRIGPRRDSEVYAYMDGHVYGMYYSELPKKYDKNGEDFSTKFTCNTNNFHFTAFYDQNEPRNHQLRVISLKRSSYVELLSEESPIVFMDCIDPKQDQILVVHENTFYALQYKFPELVIDYTQDSPRRLKPEHSLVNFTVFSDDDDDRISVQRDLVVYPLNDLSPTLRTKLPTVYDIHGYKGDIRTMILSGIYGGIVTDLLKLSGKELYNQITLESKWRELNRLEVRGEKDRYGAILRSAREDNLYLKTLHGMLYFFAFTKDVIRRLDPLQLICFQVDCQRKVLRPCTKGDDDGEASEEIQPPSMLNGEVVKTPGGGYIGFSMNDTSEQCYFMFYAWTPLKGSLMRYKYVTYAFLPKDRVISLSLYNLAKKNILVVYGNNYIANSGFYAVFEVTEAAGQVKVLFSSRQWVPETSGGRIIKLACLRNVMIAVALCEKNSTNFVLAIPFLWHSPDAIPIVVDGNVTDFLVYDSGIIIFTREDRVFHYQIGFEGASLVREIPLPPACVLAKHSDGLPLYNKEIMDKEGMVFLGMVLVQGARTDSARYKLYVIDLREATHFAPIVLLDFEAKAVLPEESIYGIYLTSLAHFVTVLVITDKYIKPFVVQGAQELSLNAISDREPFNNESFYVFPEHYPELKLTMRYTEAETTVSIYGNEEKNDTLHAFAGNFSFPVASFVKGYSLSHKVYVKAGVDEDEDGDKGVDGCRAEVGDRFELLQEIKYELSKPTLIELTENNKLFLADSENNLYVMNYSFENPAEVISSAIHVTDMINCTSRGTFKALRIENEGTYMLTANNVMSKGKSHIEIYNASGVRIHWAEAPKQGGLAVFSSETLKAFVWVYETTGSFYGQVIMPVRTSAQSYSFSSRDMECEHTSDFRCDMSRTDEILYCINLEGTIHAILLGSEGAVLISKTSLLSAQNFFPFADEKTALNIRGIVTTPINELFIDIGMGFIRCSCGNVSNPMVNCHRESDTEMLNIIPNYNHTSVPGVYATDGRVLAVKLKDRTHKNYPVIRILDLLSPFDRTEISDLVIKTSLTLDSFAVNSSAFKGSGALFAYFEKAALHVYRFHTHRRVDVHAESPQCTVRVVSRNVLGSQSDFVVKILTIPNKHFPRSIFFGIWLCVFGFSGIIFLTRRYYREERKRMANGSKSNSPILRGTPTEESVRRNLFESFGGNSGSVLLLNEDKQVWQEDCKIL